MLTMGSSDRRAPLLGRLAAAASAGLLLFTAAASIPGGTPIPLGGETPTETGQGVALHVATVGWHGRPYSSTAMRDGTSAAAPTRWKPAVGTSWQWQLSGPADLSAPVGVFVLDLDQTSTATVDAIHAKGARAVCLLPTGTWQGSRLDAAAYPAGVLGKTVAGYPDERYVDLRAITALRPVIDARLDRCAIKGFDGVAPDVDDSVVDVGAAGVGFPLGYSDQIAFDRAVAADAHARGLAIGLKNGTFGTDVQRFVADLEPVTDFALNEECAAAGGLCGALAVFGRHGKPVFHTEYLYDYPGATLAAPGPALTRFCRTTAALRFSSIVKDASSTASSWRAACP